LPDAALVILNSLRGVPTSPKTRVSAPVVSAINPPSANFGSVKVLLLKVTVLVGVTPPTSASTTFGFVASSPAA